MRMPEFFQAVKPGSLFCMQPMKQLVHYDRAGAQERISLRPLDPVMFDHVGEGAVRELPA